MIRIVTPIVASFFLILTLAAASPMHQSSKSVPAVLGFTMKDIDGRDVDLSRYQDKVVLMVNVASKCGYTPQYADLQTLFKKYEDQGLVILGFPANDFGNQEPGDNEEIKTFCSERFGVTFPMFAKVSVTGEDICPLYKHLTSSDTNPKTAGEIKWNFTKFLIGRNGEIVNRFESKVKPMSDEMVKAIESELAKPVSGAN